MTGRFFKGTSKERNDARDHSLSLIDIEIGQSLNRCSSKINVYQMTPKFNRKLSDILSIHRYTLYSMKLYGCFRIST